MRCFCVKYKVEYKLTAITAFLNGMLSQMLDIKFGIKSRSTVLCWGKNYKKCGLDDLKKSKNLIEHSIKFKKYILE
ncbi:hypothetical protein NRIC0776_00320 [Apilactobacillus kunkeei]